MPDANQRNEMDPDNFPSVKEEPLSPGEQEALQYWERFLPRLSQQLNQRSPQALPTAIRKAWWDREYQIGLTLARNPKMHRLQALEQLNPDPLYPLPEARTTQDPRR
jgi:hypothetical protein